MRITEIKKIEDMEKAVKLLRSGKIKGDDIVILWQYTGLAWLNPIITTVNNRGDIETILDDIYNNISNKDEMSFPLYDIEEIEDIYLYEDYIPINGGEYYTDTILWVEEVV